MKKFAYKVEKITVCSFWAERDLHEKLDYYGATGWELCGIDKCYSTDPSETTYLCTFKKEVE